MRGEAIVLLQARMGSRRLPGKVLAPIGGGAMLTHCLTRLVASNVGPVWLATTTRSDDDVLVEEAARMGVHVFRGASLDVLGRFAQAAKTTRADFVVRATADNPAVHIDSAPRTLDELDRGGGDYCVERGLPLGATVEAMRTEVLLDAAGRAIDAADREHVTTYIRHERGRYRSVELEAPPSLFRPDVRLTVDTASDLADLRAVAETLDSPLSSAPLSEIIRASDRVRERVA